MVAEACGVPAPSEATAPTPASAVTGPKRRSASTFTAERESPTSVSWAYASPRRRQRSLGCQAARAALLRLPSSGLPR